MLATTLHISDTQQSGFKKKSSLAAAFNDNYKYNTKLNFEQQAIGSASARRLLIELNLYLLLLL